MTNEEALEYLGIGCPPSNKAMEAYRTLRAALSAPKPVDKLDGQLDPDMPSDQLRLAMGELIPNEVLVARAAIRWANRVQPKPPPIEGLREALAVDEEPPQYFMAAVKAFKEKYDCMPSMKFKEAAKAYLELSEGV